MGSFVRSLKPIELNLVSEKPKPPEIIAQPPQRVTLVEKPQLQESQKVSEQAETPQVTTSQNAIWGPLLWKILHIIVEQLGKPKAKITQEDEVRKWIQMMKSVEHAMPCALCRGHYKEYLSRHPLNNLLPLRGIEFRNAARRYVWQLHENVNTSKNLSSGISLETCEQMYGSCEALQENLDAFSSFVQTIISSGRFKGEGLKEFRIQLTYVRKLADCI